MTPDAKEAARLRAERARAYENSRPEVRALVPDSVTRILDLGCASGALGAALKERNPSLHVTGIELDASYAAAAEARLDRVVIADLEQLVRSTDLAQSLGRYDCLIAADVLEHLVDPWNALAAYVELVGRGGTVVVSLPNVGYWETFWVLGRYDIWPRRPDGIFDRTHLRWFTYHDAVQMLADAGLELTTVSRQMRLRPNDPEPPGWLRRLEQVRGLRSLFAFQYIFAARRP